MVRAIQVMWIHIIRVIGRINGTEWSTEWTTTGWKNDHDLPSHIGGVYVAHIVFGLKADIPHLSFERFHFNHIYSYRRISHAALKDMVRYMFCGSLYCKYIILSFTPKFCLLSAYVFSKWNIYNMATPSSDPMCYHMFFLSYVKRKYSSIHLYF